LIGHWAQTYAICVETELKPTWAFLKGREGKGFQSTLW